MNRFTTNITKIRINPKTSKKTSNISIIMLCAGVGLRIKSYEPRSILKIKNKTLLEHQIDILNTVFDCPEIICVVGYDAQKIIKKNYNVRIVENQLYETTNAAESLRLAFNNTLNDNILFLHGDLFFNKETFNVKYNKSFILVDSNKRFNNSEVGVTICSDTNKASILSYGLNTKWCQIAYLTGKETKIAKNLFQKFETTHKKMLCFELLNEMITSGACFECHEPNNMSITEIDRIKDIDI
jgi:CTP:phosphocholine cytidylyltransferase-like protein